MGQGLCQMHYMRRRRTGTTDTATRRPAAERFWGKVDRSGGPDACWPWTAKRNWMGYGVFWFERKDWMAHRWAYENVVGGIADLLEVDHLCRNRACVNPSHLEAVTGRENILRGYGAAAKNARKTHCPRGHAFDAANTHLTKDGRRQCAACGGLRPNAI